MLNTRVLVGDTPVGLTEEYQYLRVSSNQVVYHQTRSAGNLIRNALSQLPPEFQCVVFLETMSGQLGISAAERRLGKEGYDHVLTCAVSSSNGIQFVSRSTRHDQVESVFGPFYLNPSEAA